MVEDSNYLARASEFFKQGEKKLKPGVFGKMFGNKSDRLEEACELFKQAANYYRLGRDSNTYSVNSSAQAFLRCAQCAPDDAANYYMEAGNIIKNVNSAEAVNHYNQAVNQLSVSGRISQAARLRKQIAEIYEQEQNISQAVDNYKQAAELFQMDNSDSTANNCWLKVAELSTLESFSVQVATEAIRVRFTQIFERVGIAFLAHNLTKYSAKDCFFKASLIFLALDVT